jgi:hypothetical protein
MQFSEIQYILRNAVCTTPPPSPALKPIPLADLEMTLELLAAILHFQVEGEAAKFAGPPLVSRKRSFEEVFGEDSDEEEEEEEDSGMLGRALDHEEQSHAASLRAIDEYNKSQPAK